MHYQIISVLGSQFAEDCHFGCSCLPSYRTPAFSWWQIILFHNGNNTSTSL